MRKINVQRKELLEKVVANKGTHKDTFEKAFDGFRKQVISATEKNLTEMQEGGAIRTYVHLEAPKDHSDDYDQVIQMLEMHTEPEIEITGDEFSKYVRDDWGWKEHWTSNTSSYTE